MQLSQLIERASAVTGSDYSLAKSLGVGRQQVSDWKHGRVACPVDIWASMAAIAGLDPVEALEAGITRGLSDERAENLRKALDMALPQRLLKRAQTACLAVAISLAGSGSPTPANAAEASVYALCQMRFRRWKKAATRFAGITQSPERLALTPANG